MTFYVDAWLDHPQPYVQVKNKYNQKVVADFSSDELSQAVEQGDICLSDFCNPCLEAQSELIKSLLLLRCCVDIGKDIQVVCHQACFWGEVRANGIATAEVTQLPVANDASANAAQLHY